jgi:hypothetical protein
MAWVYELDQMVDVLNPVCKAVSPPNFGPRCRVCKDIALYVFQMVDNGLLGQTTVVIG